MYAQSLVSCLSCLLWNEKSLPNPTVLFYKSFCLCWYGINSHKVIIIILQNIYCFYSDCLVFHDRLNPIQILRSWLPWYIQLHPNPTNPVISKIQILESCLLSYVKYHPNPTALSMVIFKILLSGLLLYVKFLTNSSVLYVICWRSMMKGQRCLTGYWIGTTTYLSGTGKSWNCWNF